MIFKGHKYRKAPSYTDNEFTAWGDVEDGYWKDIQYKNGKGIRSNYCCPIKILTKPKKGAKPLRYGENPLWGIPEKVSSHSRTNLAKLVSDRNGIRTIKYFLFLDGLVYTRTVRETKKAGAR